MSAPVLEVSGLSKRFRIADRGRAHELTAVDEVSLAVRPGETLALIGESGSGKSTLARCIARLVEPTSGEIVVNGLRVSSLPRRSLWKAYRDLQMVFQDPASSLNPRMTASAIVDEPLRLHTGLDRAGRAAAVDELFRAVGLRAELADRRPAQLSGGECQRVAIARSLAVDPKVILLDEPTASLDVSVRRRILELLQRLQHERRLAYLFISHDLEVVRHLADRVLVMYLGAIVEQGTAEEVFGQPTHPYTQALLSSATVVEYGRRKERFRLVGEIPSGFDVAAGCRLAPRCPAAEPSCSESPPVPVPISRTHRVACHFVTGGADHPRPVHDGDVAARPDPTSSSRPPSPDPTPQPDPSPKEARSCSS